MTDSNTKHENNAPATPANSARARCVGGTGRAVVVGGGLAGLMATLKLTEAGIPVDLFSVVPAKRSHSVCAQGGINAVLDTKGEGDTVYTLTRLSHSSISRSSGVFFLIQSR